MTFEQIELEKNIYSCQNNDHNIWVLTGEWIMQLNNDTSKIICYNPFSFNLSFIWFTYYTQGKPPQRHTESDIVIPCSYQILLMMTRMFFFKSKY